MEKILKILREHKVELQKKYPISRLGVFGSYARGEATEKFWPALAACKTTPVTFPWNSLPATDLPVVWNVIN